MCKLRWCVAVVGWMWYVSVAVGSGGVCGCVRMWAEMAMTPVVVDYGC